MTTFAPGPTPSVTGKLAVLHRRIEGLLDRAREAGGSRPRRRSSRARARSGRTRSRPCARAPGPPSRGSGRRARWPRSAPARSCRGPAGRRRARGRARRRGSGRRGSRARAGSSAPPGRRTRRAAAGAAGPPARRRRAPSASGSGRRRRLACGSLAGHLEGVGDQGLRRVARARRRAGRRPPAG